MENVYKMWVKIDEEGIVYSSYVGEELYAREEEEWIQLSDEYNSNNIQGTMIYNSEYIPIYRLVGNKLVKRSDAEIEAARIRNRKNQPVTMEEKIDALIKYQGLNIKRAEDGTLEVVKDSPSEGDYTNPIRIPNTGTTIIKGYWYYTDDKDLPHEAISDAFVTPEDFYDRKLFDFVM